MSNFMNLTTELSELNQIRLGLSELISDIRKIDLQIGAVQPKIESAMVQARMLAMPAPVRTGLPFESDGFVSPFEMFPEKRAGEPEHDQGPEPEPQAEGGLLSDLLAKFGKRQ